jgi:hypothetical protein
MGRRPIETIEQGKTVIMTTDKQAA